jgi:putative NADH-flavin reductase
MKGTPMKLTIFGASGGTGEHLVVESLKRGHQVTALLRTPRKLAVQHENLTIVEGDVRAAETVALAINGSDGVINAIGPTPNSPDDLMRIAAENIIAGMKQNGVDRLIWSTGAGVPAPQDKPTFIHNTIHFLLKTLSGKVLQNSLDGAEIVKNSGLNWTIARAPMLTDKPGKGNFHVSYVEASLGRSLARENFARLMLDLVESDQWIHEMPAASDE